jgi:hypothetical protein
MKTDALFLKSMTGPFRGIASPRMAGLLMTSTVILSESRFSGRAKNPLEEYIKY